MEWTEQVVSPQRKQGYVDDHCHPGRSLCLVLGCSIADLDRPRRQSVPLSKVTIKLFEWYAAVTSLESSKPFAQHFYNVFFFESLRVER